MQAAGPLKRLLPGDRIMLISATTGTVANPGSPHPGVWRVPLPVRCAERVRADRHVGLHQSDAGRQQTLPPLYRRRHRRAGRQRRHAVGRRPAPPSGAACSSVRTWATPATPTRTSSWTAPTPCSATPWAAPPPLATTWWRRWSRPGAPLSRPGFVGGLSAEGKGRVDNVGVGILARYWFLGGTYAEASLRSGRMRGSYTDDIDGSTNYRSRSNYWGPRHAGPCDAVERARPARRLCPPAVATAGRRFRAQRRGRPAQL